KHQEGRPYPADSRTRRRPPVRLYRPGLPHQECRVRQGRLAHLPRSEEPRRKAKERPNFPPVRAISQAVQLVGPTYFTLETLTYNPRPVVTSLRVSHNTLVATCFPTTRSLHALPPRLPFHGGPYRTDPGR